MRKLVLAGAAAAATVTPALADTLSGPEIREAVRGRRIYLATPLGGEFPLYYRADGRVDGSGEAIGLGRMMRPKDSGRWWVDGSRLCQQWTEWYDGRVHCFTLTRTGPQSLAWKRNDGLSGTARIGP